MSNEFLDGIIKTVGGGRITSGYRTQEEQDALRRRGVTKAVKSSHTTGTPDRPSGIDLVGVDAATAQARLRAAGYLNAVAINETGRGKNQGTGAHTHISLDGSHVSGGSKGSTTMASGTQSFDIPEVLRDQGRSDGSGQTKSEVWNPNQAGATISRDFEKTQDRALKADDVLQQAITGMINIQTRESEVLEARNERMDGLLDEQATRTQQTMERVQPLFAQKRAIVEQRQKVVNMNPLERGIRGLFDQNYDTEHLKEVEGSIDSELQLNGEEYKTMLGLQDTLLAIVDKSFQGVSMTNQLDAAHLSQNVELASKSLAAASAIWSVDMQGLSADRTLQVQQAQMTDQVLSELTPGQVNAYLDAAKKSGGIVTVNGANISEGQLLQTSQRFGQQQVQLDQLILNRQAQSAALAEKSENDLIGTMTTSQIRGAINNGGMFNGVQLPLDRLGQGLQGSMQRDTAMASGTMMQGSVDQFNYMRQSIGKSTQVAGMRAVQMTGGNPTELMNVVNAQNPQMAQIMQKIQNAPPDQRDIIAAQYVPELQKMAQQRAAAIESIATKWSGNNKDLKPLAVAFMNGQPLNGVDSAKGLVSLIRSGGTFGGNMSPEASAAVNAAKRVIQMEDQAANTPGQSTATMFGPKQNAKEKEAELIRKVSEAVAGTYANNQFESVVRSAPAIAKQIGHLGQNLDGSILRQAIDAGDEEGYRRMAAQLGLTPQEAKTMFAQGEASPIWAKAQSKAPQGFDSLNGQLAIQQSMSASQFLDQNHPKIGKYKAGAVFANLLANPRFADTAGNLSMAQGQGGFGDYIVSSLGSGTQTAQVAQYGQVALTAYNQLNTNTGMTAALKANQYNNDPLRRTATILGAIPDLIPAEEQALLKAVKPLLIGSGNEQSPYGREGVNSPAGTSQFELVRTAITSTKFQDPTLEKIRQKAAKNFDTYSRVTDEAFDRFGNYSPEEQ